MIIFLSFCEFICFKIYLMVVLEVFIDNINGLLKLGKIRMGVEVNFFFRRLKVLVCFGFYWNLIFFLRRFNKGV